MYIDIYNIHMHDHVLLREGETGREGLRQSFGRAGREHVWVVFQRVFSGTVWYDVCQFSLNWLSRFLGNYQEHVWVVGTRKHLG